MTAKKPTTLTVALPTDEQDVARLLREVQDDAPAFAAVRVHDADTYAFADALLSEVVRRKDEAIAMRKSATGPMRIAIRTVEGWFRPLVTVLEQGESHLKREIGRYRLAQEAVEREARELAARAADANDADALIEALETSTAVAVPAPGRATVGFVWGVESVDADALPREWMTPDLAKIGAFARAHKGEAPPRIAGVRFVRSARVGAKR